jgi:hypothetical protein
LSNVVIKAAAWTRSDRAPRVRRTMSAGYSVHPGTRFPASAGALAPALLARPSCCPAHGGRADRAPAGSPAHPSARTAGRSRQSAPAAAVRSQAAGSRRLQAAWRHPRACGACVFIMVYLLVPPPGCTPHLEQQDRGVERGHGRGQLTLPGSTRAGRLPGPRRRGSARAGRPARDARRTAAEVPSALPAFGHRLAGTERTRGSGLDAQRLHEPAEQLTLPFPTGSAKVK